jgi:hypothetical protein
MTESNAPRTKADTEPIPSLPYEKVINKFYGPHWRNSKSEDFNGAIGIAIIKSMADGVRSNISEIASHLGVDKRLIDRPFKNLASNGVFRNNWVDNDKKSIKENDQTALGYYAGWASGQAGVCST